MTQVSIAYWNAELPVALENAQDGETIHVRYRSQAVAGKSEAEKLVPHKTIHFQFEIDDLGDDPEADWG